MAAPRPLKRPPNAYEEKLFVIASLTLSRDALSHTIGEGTRDDAAGGPPKATMAEGVDAGDEGVSALLAVAAGTRDGLGFQLGIGETEVMVVMPC